MKRLISLLLAVLLLIPFCACESEEERARREIQESIKSYQDAQRRSDEIQAQIDITQAQIDILEGLLGK